MPLFSRRGEPAQSSSDRRLAVNLSRCPQNHPCPSVRVCPVGALSQIGFHAPAVDENKCIRCGKCVRFCPRKALTLESISNHKED